MKRIVVTGAESTGKTTLARELAGAYSKPWTPEYVREWVETHRRAIRAGDLDAIARGQLEAEDRPLADSPELVVHDTNLLSNIVYMRHYFNTEPDWLEPAFRGRDYTLYLLCLPDVTWEPDPGQREGPEARQALHAVFKETLEDWKLPFIEVGGSIEERIRSASIAIKALG